MYTQKKNLPCISQGETGRNGTRYSCVRRFGIHEIALREGRREKAKDLLRHLTDLEPKGKGEISMSGKRLNKKGCIVMCRKSCPQELSAKRERLSLHWLNPNLQ
jgi:hypothetical protein